MSDPVRVVLDLAVSPEIALNTRELAFFLAQAVADFRQTHLSPADTCAVVALRVPEDTQSFVQARELYDEEAFRRWQRQRLPPLRAG